jgi:hypothetical protein
LIVADFEAVDDGAEVGLPARDLTDGQALTPLHRRSALGRIDEDRQPVGARGAVQGGAGGVAIGLEKPSSGR